MRLQDLMEEIAYRTVRGPENPEITAVVYDSRKACPGCVFVCLQGAAADGHRFAAQAVQQGAVAVVAVHEVDIPMATLVLVEDTRFALACMSAAFFGHPARELTTIGITGTKGKTTTACMVRTILEQSGRKTGMIGTLGIVIGEETLLTDNTTPESYEIQRGLRRMVETGCRCAVIEASSLGLKWHRTAGFCFDYGLFTNFSPDHIGQSEHNNLEEYLACKRLLFRQCKTGLLNRDDATWEEMLQGHTCRVLTFGFSNEADYIASGERLIARPGYLGVHFTAGGRRRLAADVAIPGKFSVYNALAALAVCDQIGADDEAVRKGLDTVKVPGRVEAVPVPGEYTLLIDYAHNAVSMENILTTLREYRPNRLICLFGAGGNRARDRRFTMGEICGKLADLSVITEDNSRDEPVEDIIEDILTGMKKTDGSYVVVPDRRKAIRYCMEHAQKGDIVVLAGKGHETYQEIHGEKRHFDEREVIAQIIDDQKKRGFDKNS